MHSAVPDLLQFGLISKSGSGGKAFRQAPVFISITESEEKGTGVHIRS